VHSKESTTEEKETALHSPPNECTLSESATSSSARLLASLRARLAFHLSRRSLDVHFAGLSSALFAITIQNGLFYFFFQWFKNHHRVNRSPLGNLFVGGEAGVATVLLTNWLWVVNSRQVTDRKVLAPSLEPKKAAESTLAAEGVAPAAALATSVALVESERGVSGSTPAAASASLCNVGFFTACRMLFQREGWRWTADGLGPALLLVSSPSIQFASYEYLSALQRRAGARAALTNLELFYLGAISKIIATLLTYPIQTTKGKLQSDGSPYAKSGVVRGVIDATRDMLHSPDGIASFYRGLRAKILQTSLTAAFLFLFRERMIALIVVLQQTAHLQ
jgi:adenine nucleotide transporter 17